MDADRQIDIEQQRARIQMIVRDCDSGIFVGFDSDGELTLAYMNMSPIEWRGLIDLLNDTKPRFFQYLDEDDDDDEG